MYYPFPDKNNSINTIFSDMNLLLGAAIAVASVGMRN